MYNRCMDQSDIWRNHYIHTCFAPPTFIHSHNFFELSFCVHGNSINVINGEHLPFKQGACAILRPGDKHFFVNTANESAKIHYEHKDIYIHPDKFREVCDSLHPDLYAKIAESQSPLFFHLSDAAFNLLYQSSFLLETAIASENKYFSVIHVSLVSLILSQWIENSVVINPSFPRWLTDLIPLFNNITILSKNITEISAIAGYSLPYFSSEFKKYMGMSPIKFLIKKRLEFSTTLLIEGKLSITDIAEILGFSNSSCYSKHFFNEYGTTPSSYRKHNS